MADSGNINANTGANQPLNPKSSSKKAAKAEPSLSSNTGQNSQALNQNRGVYNTASNSQLELGKNDNQDQEQLPNKKSDFMLEASNPTLAAKLNNRKKQDLNNKKQKKTPPQPSIQVKYSPRKGKAINPRKVQSNIPGRLGSFLDDGISEMKKLEYALDSSNQNKYLPESKKSLPMENLVFETDSNIAELIDLDLDIALLDKHELLQVLKAKAAELEAEPELQNILNDIIVNISENASNDNLLYLLQLFMPLPFPYRFLELDEEFENDYAELLEDERKEKEEQGEDDDDDEEPEASAILSIDTLYFNKINFVLKYFKDSNKVNVILKGSPLATELVIPIESQLEEAIEDDVNDIGYLISTWHDNVLKVTESRELKVKSEGKLNPVLLKACNGILESIIENDESDGDDMMNDDFGLV